MRPAVEAPRALPATRHRRLPYLRSPYLRRLGLVGVVWLSLGLPISVPWPGGDGFEGLVVGITPVLLAAPQEDGIDAAEPATAQPATAQPGTAQPELAEPNTAEPVVEPSFAPPPLGPSVVDSTAYRQTRQAVEIFLDDVGQQRNPAYEALDLQSQACRDDLATAAEAQTKPPGEVGRQTALDQAFDRLGRCAAELHRQVGWLRSEPSLAPRYETLTMRLRQGLQQVTAAESPSEDEVEAWLALQRSLVAAHRDRLERQQQALSATLELSLAVTESRLRLAPRISSSVRTDSARGFVAEWIDEVEELPVILRHRTTGWLALGKSWPRLLAEVLSLGSGLLEWGLVLLLVLVWFRWRKVAGLSKQLMRWVQESPKRKYGTRATVLPLIMDRLITASAQVWTGALDLLLLLASYALVLHRFEVATPWLGIVGLGLLWRLVVPSATLLVASPIERRSSWLVGNRSFRNRVSATLRWILAWGGLSLLALTLVRQALSGFRLYETVQFVSRWSLLLLLLVLLHRWGPLLRRQVRRQEGGRWTRWLGTPAAGRMGNLFKAMCNVVYLLVRAAWGGATRFLGTSGKWSWLSLQLARGEIAEGQTVQEPLTAQERQRIESTDVRVARREDMERLQKNLEGWRLEGNRGLAALIGHQGSGKSHFLDRIAEQAATDEDTADLEVVRWRLQRRLFGAREALLWLLSQLQGLDDGSSADIDGDADADPDALRARVAEALEVLPPTLFLLDDIHLALLRAIGGFDAFEALKTCLHASSSRHFWVLSFHRPAWAYIEGVAVNINLDVFRTRLYMKPWTADELTTWLTARTQQAGFEIDYASLVRRSPFDEDLKDAESQDDIERARQAFWQLLTNACSGNPEVASLYWLNSLCHDQGGNRLSVKYFEEPPTPRLQGHGDLELFVLTALWIHGRLPLKALVQVLNMPVGAVEMACRHLDSVGVLSEDESLGFALEGRWRPAVVHLLRLRHFWHDATPKTQTNL